MSAQTFPTFFSLQETVAALVNFGTSGADAAHKFGFTPAVVQVNNFGGTNTATIIVTTSGGARTLVLQPLSSYTIPGPVSALSVNSTSTAIEVVAAPQGVIPGGIPAWPTQATLSNGQLAAVTGVLRPLTVVLPIGIQAAGVDVAVAKLFINKTGRSILISDVRLRVFDVLGAWGTVDAGNTAVFALTKTGAVILATSITFNNVTTPPANTGSQANGIFSLSVAAGALTLAAEDEILLSITNGPTAATPSCGLQVTYTIL